MKVALDTNVLVYAEGWADSARCRQARDLSARLVTAAETVISAEVLGELHRVLSIKAKQPPDQIKAPVLERITNN